MAVSVSSLLGKHNALLYVSGAPLCPFLPSSLLPTLEQYNHSIGHQRVQGDIDEKIDVL
jgi:hypothetical protein